MQMHRMGKRRRRGQKETTASCSVRRMHLMDQLDIKKDTGKKKRKRKGII
jgi:hypothetical protein